MKPVLAVIVLCWLLVLSVWETIVLGKSVDDQLSDGDEV